MSVTVSWLGNPGAAFSVLYNGDHYLVPAGGAQVPADFAAFVIAHYPEKKCMASHGASAPTAPILQKGNTTSRGKTAG